MTAAAPPRTPGLRPPDVVTFGERLADRAGADQLSGAIRAGLATKDAVGDLIAEMAEQSDGPVNGDLEQLLLQYESSLWVYAAAFAIASNLAQVPLIAVGPAAGDPDEVEDQPHSMLQQLIDAPAVGVTRHELIERITLYLELAGSEFVYADRGGVGERATLKTDGEILELRPLRPSRITIHPASVPGGIDHYGYEVAGAKLKIAPANIGFVRFANPNDDYWGLSPVQLIQRSIAVDLFGENFNRSLVESGGRPDAVATTKNHMTRRAKNQVRHEYERNFARGKSGGLMVLDDDLTIGPSGFSPKDMEYAELMRSSKHRILAAYGVPPLMVMDLRDASVLANADTQMQLFFRQTVMPVGDRIAATLTRLIRTDPRWSSEPGWGLRFGWSRVKALTTQAEEVVANTHWTAGGITRNEYRRRIGEEPVEDGGDDYHTTPAPADPLAGLFLGGDAPARKGVVTRVSVPSEEHKALARVSFRRMLRDSVRQMQAATERFFAVQAKRVVARLRGVDLGAKGTSRQKATLSELLATVYTADEVERLREALGPMFLDQALDAGNLRLEALFPNSTLRELTAENERFRALVQTWGARRVVGIDDATREAIASTLDRSLQSADTLAEMKTSLLDTFRAWSVPPAGTGDIVTRAERIARTESSAALNSGSYTAAVEATSLGIELRKSWLSARDSRVRDEHRDLDSSTSSAPIPLETPFSNGLQHPNDMSAGDAASVANCRCSLLEIVVE